MACSFGELLGHGVKIGRTTVKSGITWRSIGAPMLWGLPQQGLCGLIGALLAKERRVGKLEPFHDR
jgi:hypothetical protein